MSEKFTLTISEPSAGWFDATIVAPEGEYAFLGVSYLSDGLAALVAAAEEIAIRRGGLNEPHRFTWQDEPGAWEWMIESGEEETLAIRIMRHGVTFPRAGMRGRQVYSCQVDAGRFCRGVLRAFDGIAWKMEPERYREQWRRRWPERSLEALREAVRAWGAERERGPGLDGASMV